MATSSAHEPESKAFSLLEAYTLIRAALPSSNLTSSTPSPLPQPPFTSVPPSLPTTGLGDLPTLQHILQDLTPHFQGSKTSPNFYGFVTGGVLPIAEAADLVVGAWDQNVQLHLPEVTGIATTVEWWAGRMLGDLLGLGYQDGGSRRGEENEGLELKRWQARTFTTGATGSNILGLACAREAILQWRLDETSQLQGQDGDEILKPPSSPISMGELGLLEACHRVGITGFQILTSMSHSSLSKAASIVGLGRASVVDVGLALKPWQFDMRKLEERLKIRGLGSVVVVGCGEVNTGRFATGGVEEMRKIRALCDSYGAWLHVDGAFGLFARVLEATEEFDLVRKGIDGMELADSITGDCHKLLNVPYDCGFFLTHSSALLHSVFQNPNAAYLSTSSTSSEVPSPLNTGLENSRRFRALPVYAVLLSLGRAGLQSLFMAQIRLARTIAKFLSQHISYELLPRGEEGVTQEVLIRHVHIVVLFRAKDPIVNAGLAQKINSSGRIVVSGTWWAGQPAVRIAVGTWMVDGQRDGEVITEVLEKVLL